jgi:nicotinamide mononucleotide transporter
MDPLELVAVALGIANVVLTIRQSLWCWPTGLAMVILYGFVFFEARLYSDVVLQVVYVVLQVWGWWKWLHGGDRGGVLRVTRVTTRTASIALTVGVVATSAWGYAMWRWTDAAAPFADSGIAVFSLVAQYGLGRKILENWLVWIAVDVVAVIVYATRALHLTSGLYAVFLVLATLGFLRWKKTLAAPAPA